MGRHAAAGTMLTAAVAMLSAVDNTEAFVYSTLLSVNPKPWSSIRRTTASRQLPTFGLGSGARPLSQASCQRRVVKMDTGDDLEKLESIPGMPETINVTPVFNATALSDAFVDNSAAGLPWAQWTHSMPRATNLPILGGFGIPRKPPSTGLPEYLVEPTKLTSAARDAAAASSPTDHAVSVAKEIAQKIAEARPSLWEDKSEDPTASKSVTMHVIGKEKQQTAAATRAKTGPARIDASRLPNLWLAVAHSSSVKPGEVKKVQVDGIPIALWRSAAGELSAISDVCIHRGASLARGVVATDRLVCPYHGFEFETDGCLAYMPGCGQKAAAKSTTPRKTSDGVKAAVTYPVKEAGGWVYIFPDETRPGSIEQHTKPFVIPEAESPNFRAVSGSMDIDGGVGMCVENLLDMLHISFVHSFGNLQEPTPFELSYADGFDDPGTEALPTSQVTFRYRSGSRSFSKLIGGAPEVVVKNEFHLPYRAVIRVFFGSTSLKTVEATAVPVADGKTTLHWKVYRNFAMTHPLDNGPINKAVDLLFQKMMEVTLLEDKEIIENIYPEYQKGFMNARYDTQILQYRRAITQFQEKSKERANSQLESSLQMELLDRIARSQRGLAATFSDQVAIQSLIERLEKGSRSAGASEVTAQEEEVYDLEGQWHLEYMGKMDVKAGKAAEGWDFAGSSESEKTDREAALKDAGGEALLFDWNDKGRPMWADTSESVQIIDTKKNTLTNRAVYKGWSGLTTVVQLDACIKPLNDQANRIMVGFHKAMVNVGGIKVAFPHLQRFSPTGWLETTYVNEGIRIARGNRGSIFVLTRQPVTSSVLFDEK